MCGVYVTLWHPAVAPIPAVVPVISVVVKNTFDKAKALLILNSATLCFNFIYKFLSNKKFLLVASGKAERLRILPCQIFHLS